VRIFAVFHTCAIAVPLLLALPVNASRAPAGEGHAIAGVWTLNSELSDQRGRDQRDQDGAGRRGSGGRGAGGRRGGGGMGGGWGGRGGRRPGAGMNQEEMARLREAVRDLTNPSNHLTIVETESMIVITSADGHTTRLSPDGKKIKDDNTGIERKTKWDGARLVTEISGLGPAGKATLTIAANPESHQLRIVVQMEGGRSAQGSGPRTITNVYDDDKYTK
jgi:hypothetical protein